MIYSEITMDTTKNKANQNKEMMREVGESPPAPWLSDGKPIAASLEVLHLLQRHGYQETG